MFVIGVIFVTVVLPIWLFLHYLTRWKSSRDLSKEDARLLEEIWKSMNNMETRINSLETILSHENDNWRKEV